MREKTKKVYYCDFCKKHGLSRAAMVKHEVHCTMNPERLCRWWLIDYDVPRAGQKPHRMRRGLPRWLRLCAPLSQQHVDSLREHCCGCPACMLAAIRQSGIDRFIGFDYATSWDYDEEVKRYREDEREYWRLEERRDIESSFL